VLIADFFFGDVFLETLFFLTTVFLAT
jgi:hypothetical protein